MKSKRYKKLLENTDNISSETIDKLIEKETALKIYDIFEKKKSSNSSNI